MNNKHIAILVDNYFEQAEFDLPISAMKDAGAEVTVIATKQYNLQGLHHVDKGDKYRADLLLKDASYKNYDALVLPGGAINADTLRVNEVAQDWATYFLENDKVIAVICHAPWLLVSADIVDGRKLTSYHTISDDIANAGGIWIDKPVVIDGNLISSRKPDDISKFNQAIIDRLKSNELTTLDNELSTVTTDEISTEKERQLSSLDYDRRRVQHGIDYELLDDSDVTSEELVHLSSFSPEKEED